MEPAGKLVEQLSQAGSSGKISFVKCDVTKYDDLYALFKTAHDKYGRVDHAVACAGIFEQGSWFDPALNVETVGQERATTVVIDVNVIGSANFARIAVVFLRDGLQKDGNRSLTLLSSVNAFRESPGLYMYQVSTHNNSVGMRCVVGLLTKATPDLQTCHTRPDASNAQADL